MSRFKKGDLVELKTGGPTMVVDAIHDEDGRVTCVWFDSNERQVASFAEETLIQPSSKSRGQS